MILDSPTGITFAIRSRADLSDEERWQVHARQAQTFDLTEEFTAFAHRCMLGRRRPLI